MTIASSPGQQALKDHLIGIARLLDEGLYGEAVARFLSAPLTSEKKAVRLVALTLWKRLVADGYGAGALPIKDAERVLSALAHLSRSIEHGVFSQAADKGLDDIRGEWGVAQAAAVAGTTLWDIVLEAPEGTFGRVFELFFDGGGRQCLDAWTQFLGHRPDYAPVYWNFAQMRNAFRALGHQEFADQMIQAAEDAGRRDLKPLLSVYLLQMQQVPVPEIMSAALALEDPEQRGRFSDCMLGIGYMPDELGPAVESFRELVRNDENREASISFMEARLANAERRWADVLPLTTAAQSDPKLVQLANVVEANALACLGQADAAETKLDDLVSAPDVPDFMNARAEFIRVTAKLVEKDLPLPEDRALKVNLETVGRPLAQSLWVGKRLRWIERLAIKSYLDNGWRFQLYAYDDISNVPSGCEILDANVIVPEREVFTEGPGSGLHVGSVGAFSDLFRYKMLHDRGGMWTDTDVINLGRYDPEGMQFVSSELTDAGLITLNGAIMAAPAGNEFVATAYERSRRLLRGDEMFFTRIGPYLIAELLLELGFEAMDIQPPQFLSPVFPMNTGSLLQPYERVVERPEIRDALNMHVYTEMWRLLGLGLESPPNPATYLGRLYADALGEQAVETVGEGDS